MFRHILDKAVDTYVILTGKLMVARGSASGRAEVTLLRGCNLLRVATYIDK